MTTVWLVWMEMPNGEIVGGTVTVHANLSSALSRCTAAGRSYKHLPESQRPNFVIQEEPVVGS